MSKLIGRRSGKLLVISKAAGHRNFNVLCDCGKTKVIQATNLPRTKSCGCEGRRKLENYPSIEGKQFGRLKAIKRIRSGTTKYICRCECGVGKVVTYINLMSGGTKSCGCLQKELVAKRSRKTPGYSTTTSIYNYYKRNARLRQLVWELSREHFVRLIFTN